MRLLRKCDELIESTTMYRLAVYILSVYALVGITLSALGVLSLSTGAMLLSFAIIMSVGFVANTFFAWLYKASQNFESGIITALILFCILPPATTPMRAFAIGLTVVIAMASKYVIAWRFKHIFNPAAFAAVAIGLTELLHATWWIGTPAMLPLTLIGGLLIARKLRKFKMILLFIVTALIVMLLINPGDQAATTTLRNAFLSWPLLFFATIMLTEPSTMPPTRYYQLLYALLIGALFSSRLELGPLHTTPEVSLLIGNLFAYMIGQRYNVKLHFKEKIKLNSNTYEYIFKPSQKLKYTPGQYMEWTLPVSRLDSRGNRRTFTIASSPTDTDVRLGVKFYEPSSSFKNSLQKLTRSNTLMAGHIAGDFTLPADTSKKLVFIAGGIGITPYISMLRYLQATGQERDIVLFYAISTLKDAAYTDLLIQFKRLKIVYLTDAKTLSPETLHKESPNFKERVFYISGPPAMVKTYRQILRTVGVSGGQIKTDYFSGY